MKLSPVQIGRLKGKSHIELLGGPAEECHNTLEPKGMI